MRARRVVLRLRRAQGQSMLRGSAQRETDGVLLAVGVASEDQGEFFTKCAQALALIKAHDPRRYSRLRRDLRVVFMSAGGGPYYDPGIDGCVIDARSVRAASVMSLAATLVHEATHARLSRMGVGEQPACVERREAICVGAEVDFLTRIPGADDLIARVEAATRRPWYTEEARQERIWRFVDGYGLPRWVGKLIILFGRRWK